MIGRPPKPNTIKQLIGSKNARRGGTEPAKGIPKCPRHLNDAARKRWRELIPVLRDMGILTVADGDALAMYCIAFSRWTAAEKQLDTDGVVVKSPNGYPIQSPFLAVANGAMAQMEKLLARFGMTPADRTRIHYTAPADESPLDRFIRNKPEPGDVERYGDVEEA